MKLNKWTLGLAAVGVVSLASVARAEEQKNALQTALSSTTISGYVDTSAQWNFDTANVNLPGYKFGGPDKADGFNLDVIQLSIAKPLDESEWAAGYKVDLWFGPDANNLHTTSANVQGTSSSSDNAYHKAGSSDFAIRQAYVALRMPLGNGLDFKMGVFDTIIGYESLESGNNPNYTRSYGNTIEPQTHTGLLATYRFCDAISASVGIANTVGPAINQRAFGGNEYSIGTDGNKAESYKSYMGSIALTAPSDWGWLAGSTLYGGVVNGFNENQTQSDINENTTSWYAGLTLATPVTGLKFGVAFDYLDVHHWDEDWNNAWAVGVYASYQATEKLSLHLRGEYVEDQDVFGFGPNDKNQIYALTATVQYDLWQNVISRLEFRWDHGDSGNYFGYNSNSSYYSSNNRTSKDAFMLAANVIYKF